MLKRIIWKLSFLVLLVGSPVLADEIELDWNAAEVGFFEKVDEKDHTLQGVAVYVPSNRIALEEDFNTIVPAFCSTDLSGLLEYTGSLEDAPELSLLRIQLEFYGPKIGESEPYIARAATVELQDGECLLE